MTERLRAQWRHGFEPLPSSFLIAMWIIVGLYVISAEFANYLFYKKGNF
ncbi:MAG: hypothetical protein PWQ57_538 [Desulfovibrionales bacterium]|nr:hypothetical protein [Desulfovibrionales bacterium]